MPSCATPVSNGGTLPEVRSARASLVIVARSTTRSSTMTAKRPRKSLPSTQGIEDPEPGTFADQDSSDNDDDAGEDREPTPEGDPGDPQ
jgi:hypothetical protein